MASPKILISGSGIAGSVFAFWALRAFRTADITIIERAPTFRLTGSSVDIRSSGIDVMKRMGLEQAVRDHSTQEKGLRFVRANGKITGTMEASGNSETQSITSEFEIFRSDLARILLEPSMDRVKIIFDDWVKAYEDNGDGVTVTFAKSQKTEKYDLLVAADGVNSKIRGQMLSTDPKLQVHDEGVHVAYFTAKSDLLNGSKYAETYSTVGGRVVMIRPDPNPAGRSKVLLMNVTTRKDTAMKKRLNDAVEGGNDAYKAFLRENFADAGWKAPQVLEEMERSDDFYCSLFAQVRSPRLCNQSRVVLLGDAGYATPGMGTSLAMMGGYSLAGELLQTSLSSPDGKVDLSAAIDRYEKLMQPFVKKQQGDDSAMQLLNPQSRWGVALRDVLIGIVTGLRIDRIAMAAATTFGMADPKLNMPEYAWPEA